MPTPVVSRGYLQMPINGTLNGWSNYTVGTSRSFAHSLGETPVGMKFMWVGRTEATDANGGGNAYFGCGVAVSTSKRYGMVLWQQDAGGNYDGLQTRLTTNSCIALAEKAGGTPSWKGKADLNVAFDGTNFQLIIDVEFTVAITVLWEAYGSMDFDCGLANLSSGTTSVTGLSFRPKGIETVMLGATGTSDGTTSGDVQVSYGMASGSGTGQQVTLALNERWTGTARSGGHYSHEGEIMAHTFSGLLDDRQQFSTFNNDGFSLVEIETGNNNTYLWIAYGGDITVDVRRVDTRTDTNDIVENDLGFTPFILKVMGGNVHRATDSLGTGSVQLTQGVAVSPTDRACVAVTSQQQTTPEVWTGIEFDAIYLAGDFADGIAGICDIKSIDTDLGYTLVMDDADPSAKVMMVMAIGPKSVTIPAITRRRRAGQYT